MKIAHITKVALMASLLSAPIAQADTIYGVYIGAQGWQTEPDGNFDEDGGTDSNADFNFDDDTASAFYIAIEHPIPFLPNLKVRKNKIETEADITGTLAFGGEVFSGTAKTDADISNTDFVLYYEILDNDLTSIDLGVNGKHIDGDIDITGKDIAGSTITTNESFSGVVPMAYAAAEFGLPFTGLSIYSDISYGSYDGHTLSDYQAGVAWKFIDNLAVDMSLQAGYRSFNLELDDLDNINTDIDVKGFYAGLQVHF